MAVATDERLRGLVRNETLTRGLGDVEGRMLVDWVVGWAELLTEAAPSDTAADSLLARLLRRGRAIARFVSLWCDPSGRPAAAQLAAAERLAWPFPAAHRIDPPDVMAHILNWEDRHRGE
jgi:hypothetical protein